jgi:type VI secretion system protein VasG
MADDDDKIMRRLNDTTQKALVDAYAFAERSGNPEVEIAHLFTRLLDDPTSDLSLICSRFKLDMMSVAKGLGSALETLPRGARQVSQISYRLVDLVRQSWSIATLRFEAVRIRSGHLLATMLVTDSLRGSLQRMSPELAKIPADALVKEFADIVRGSSEGGVSANPAASSQLADAMDGGAGEDALSKYSVDLTAKARAGEIDAIVGRDPEIRQVVDILLRRRQNNPILLGDAGVGKTAVAEGFARRIVNGDVPPPLRGVTLRSLDIGLLQAGASMKGEFEKRLRQVIDEVEAAKTPVIMFIDEAHTLIGAGGAAGSGDAANLLKPALARGKLRTIAATTWAEYRQYIEKDPALVRRFQPVAVMEPETQTAIDMLRSVAPLMERHHKVTVLDEAIEAAVKLSQRYVPARQLPDKAVSLIDTACARVAVSQHSIPAEVEDRRRTVELLKVEAEIAAREIARGGGRAGRPAEIAKKIAEAEAARTETEKKWESEKAAVTALAAIREAAVGGDDAARERIPEAREAVVRAQGDAPMVFGEVDADAVAAIIAAWTGIPVGRMVKDEIASVLAIEDKLKSRVLGQDHAMAAIAKRIRTSRAKLDNPSKPVGVFMLCGPSGVGKTETAHALSELLYSGEESLIVINMSEFQEAHTVSTLKGSPPGYVGYGQGGVLTEAVRRRPYSVVLLDEVEKAHPDVHEMFFQVFDKGFMEDSEGRYIDFRNTVILLTSNVGTDLIMTLSEDPDTMPESEALAAALRPDLLKVFPPALLGRLNVLPYYPLSPSMIRGITELQLKRIGKRITEAHGVPFSWTPAVVDHVVERCNELASGGRMIDAILTNGMLPDMATLLLEKMMRGEKVVSVEVAIHDQEIRSSIGG